MAIWEMDAETGEMWWSPRAGELFGSADASDAPRTRLPHVVQRIHPEDRARFQAAVSDAVSRAGEVHSIQVRVVWPDGQVRWLEARGQSWEDPDGRLKGLRGTLVDLTESKRVEEDLRRSSGMYRAYFTASPLAVFVSDDKGRYLEVNGAATALTGYSRDELLGMSIPDLLPAAGGEDLRSRLTGLLALGAGRSEIEIRRKDGSLRHCILHATAIEDGRLLGFLLDITDRRDAEERVRESEERFRGLSEASFEAILVHENGRIVDVNQAFCELGGYSWHELIGRDAFELIVPEDRETVYRTLLAEYDRPYEISGLRRDGTPLPVEVQARSFPFRGRVLRVVALRDISERRKAEDLQRSLIRDLELKNAELERFAHTVSHDLKAPLITIRGFAAHLVGDLEGGRSERLEADVARIVEAVGQMQSLLDHLVDLSRAGESTATPTPVDLNSVAREALEQVRQRRRKELEAGVSVVVGERLPTVLGDHKALVQVLQHVMDNAVKASANAHEPVVTVEDGGLAGGEAAVVVRDNGRGIDPIHHERVFGPFEKLDPAAEGSGVGLAIVKRIVTALGGRVRLDSGGTGCGTAVWIRLPVPSEAGEPDTIVSTTPAASRPLE
jgi:PAS domain S-box-containing protein